MVEVLPSGNRLITNEESGTYLILILNAGGFGVEMLGPNPYEPGSEAWYEKENEIAEKIKMYS